MPWTKGQRWSSAFFFRTANVALIGDFLTQTEMRGNVQVWILEAMLRTFSYWSYSIIEVLLNFQFEIRLRTLKLWHHHFALLILKLLEIEYINECHDQNVKTRNISAKSNKINAFKETYAYNFLRDFFAKKGQTLNRLDFAFFPL